MDWLVVLMPFLTLALLTLYRFVGCSFHGGPPTPGCDPPGEGDEIVPRAYEETVLPHPNLESYWPLGGTALFVVDVDPGGTPHPGVQDRAVLPAVPVLFSPATPDPPILDPNAPGLLESAPARPALRVHGGYARVPFTVELNSPGTASDPTLPDFSVEAWVRPEWPVDEVPGFRTVVASRDEFPDGAITRRQGYVLYAGPKVAEEPGDPDIDLTAYYWQVWVGDGAIWRMLKGPRVFDPVTPSQQTVYLAATFRRRTVEGDHELALWINDQVVTKLVATFEPNRAKPLYIGIGAPERPVPDPPAPGEPHRPDPLPPANEGPLFPFHGRIQEAAVYRTWLFTSCVRRRLLDASLTP
jgi:hypothetical protein